MKRQLRSVMEVVGMVAFLAGGVALGAPVCKEETPGLKARAKLTCEKAEKAALARVPGGKVESAELEEEHGKLVFSFDIRVPKKAGIEEVQVDAVSGEVVSVEHEDAASEAAEKKHEGAEKNEKKQVAPK